MQTYISGGNPQRASWTYRKRQVHFLKHSWKFPHENVNEKSFYISRQVCLLQFFNTIEIYTINHNYK